MSLVTTVLLRHAVLALSLSTITAAVGMAQGTISLSPDYAPSPQVYATTGDLMSDSLSLAWDGDKPVLIRLMIVEVINGAADRFLSGATLTLEPGSRFIRLSELLPPMMIGADLPVVRWATAANVIDANGLRARRWDDSLLESLIGEDAPVAWPTEALLVIGFSVEGPDAPEGVEMLAMLVVRPAPLPDVAP